MPLPRSALGFALMVPAALLAGCQTTTSPQIATAPAEPLDPAAVAPVDPSTLDPTNPIEETAGLGGLGEPEIPLLGGYRSVNDPCRIAGESRFTRRYLDDSADLVACLRGGGAERIINAGPGVTAVAQTPSYTLFSVPRGAFDRAITG